MKEHFPGRKTKYLFDNLISKAFPTNISSQIYVEPFGGTFAVGNLLNDNQYKKIYNDINTYDFKIDADIIEHMDFEDLIDKYDSPLTFFYVDPPYYDKEYVYGLKKRDTDFHLRLFYKLKHIKGKFVLSYLNNPFITNLYKDFTIITNETDRNTMRSHEIVIKNF